MAATSPLPLNPEHVLADGLALPASDRLQIAAELLASVDEPVSSTDDEAWLAEMRARAERPHRGESRALPWEDVKQGVLARLRYR